MSDVEQAKAHFFTALDLLDARSYVAAEEHLRKALAIVPDRPSALSNLASALYKQDRYEEAAEVAGKTVQIAPDAFEGWLVLGSALGKQGLHTEALAAANRAVALAPTNARVRMGRAFVHVEMKQLDLALADLHEAMRIAPDEEDLLATVVTAQMHACEWHDIGPLTERLMTGVRAGTQFAEPFAFLGMPSTAQDQLNFARALTARDYPAMPPLYRGEAYSHERIRVAYFSGDFRRHPLSYLMAGIFEHHDRTRFETFGVSLGNDDASEIRSRISRSFEHFADLRGKPDGVVAAHLHENRIDVAVDLGGFTSGGRPRAFAMRPAPMQVSYLGFPGTTGAPYMDYILADATVIPADQRKFYSEAPVWLPDTYFPNDNRREIAAEVPTRAAAGLPETGFVFCSFNNAYKITPPIFDIWMRLLSRVEGSVLWLLQSNAAMRANLGREAAARGIDPARLVFARHVPAEQHLARHRLADLSLDTSPYNAHTTACDALWTGLPLLTCIGSTFPSRVAASVLQAMELPELVTQSFEAYEALALLLARDPERLAAVKAKVVANRDKTALFDTGRLTRHLEAAYATMVERHRQGLSPAPFAVEPIARS